MVPRQQDLEKLGKFVGKAFITNVQTLQVTLPRFTYVSKRI